ncbi:MAG: type II secretion system protein [Candidatus Omnitrophica bacterium]|nr:type II secretion system protein [Candidatus Omnitrophota bacterium]MBI3010070.1 type II secretion system protein [Candidatus Omnitrophota bacterium]
MRHGLTLIEIIVTISLLAIIAVPASLLLSEPMRAAISFRESTVAMGLARSELEQLDALNDFCHADLALTSASGITVDPYQGFPYALTRIVSCQTGDCSSNCNAPNNNRNGIKRIEIRVSRSGSSDVLARLTNYRTKYVLFGP